jgi:hypothetical protein
MNALTIHQPSVPTYEVGDVWKMAQAVAQSGLFGMKRPEEAMALMLVAQAEGTHPALAARDYHIVDGRPTLKADAMLARFMQAGGKVKWHDYGDEAVKATFSHPQGGEVTVDWTLKRAAQIKRKGKPLTDGDNWKNYPRAMLRARVISEGIRTVFPGCVVGVYTPEEVQDFDDVKPAQVRDVTPPRAEPKRTAPAQVIDAPAVDQPVDRSAEPVPTPDGDDKDEWDAWRKVIASKINRAASEQEVVNIQQANTAGIMNCANVLEDTVERFAALIDAKMAKLAAPAEEQAS